MRAIDAVATDHLDRADHLTWVLSSSREQALESLPERPWTERVIVVRWLVAAAGRIRSARAGRNARPVVPTGHPSQSPQRPGLRHP